MAFATTLAFSPVTGSFAAGTLTQRQAAALDENGRTILREMQQLIDEDLAAQRRSCALGEAPGWVRAKRVKYGEGASIPDAATMCVALMAGDARDGHITLLYRKLLGDLGGDVIHADSWPRAIGAAVLSNKTDIEIGNRKTIEVKPALAFDAGFTVAFQDGRAGKAQQATDPAQVAKVAEACLGEGQDAGTCFSVGYVYGTAAVSGQQLAAP